MAKKRNRSYRQQVVRQSPFIGDVDLRPIIIKFHRQGYLCQWCQRPLLTNSASKWNELYHTIDHVHPGQDLMVWCCRRCNTIKSDMTIDEWLEFMEDNPNWWLMTRMDRRDAIKRTRWYRRIQATDPTRSKILPTGLAR